MNTKIISSTKSSGNNQKKSYGSKRRNQANVDKNKGFRFNSPNIRTKVIAPDVGGFADEYHCTLQYQVLGQLQGSGSTTSAIATYFINSPGSLTHAPKGWAVLINVYNQYLVKGFSARVTATNLSATIPVKTFVVPVNSDYAAALVSNIPDLSETDGVISRQMGISSGGHDAFTLDYPYTQISALAGLTHPVNQDNDDFSGFTGSPNSASTYLIPRINFQLVVAFASLTGANLANNSISLGIELRMNVVFFGKLPIY